LAMQAELRDFQEVNGGDSQRLQMRIAVHNGPVIFGSSGEPGQYPETHPVCQRTFTTSAERRPPAFPRRLLPASRSVRGGTTGFPLHRGKARVGAGVSGAPTQTTRVSTAPSKRGGG
jgi:hypothetical protein